MARRGEPYWSRPAIEVLQECRSRPTGLTSTEARNWLSRQGPNTFAELAVLLRQFCNPLVLMSRATVRGLIEDACSAGHRQGALPFPGGPELEATEAHRR
ncbi:cation-transporting P-type ATPase [Mesorhizobium hawassense]|uniref:cation-transporting P-type ATPase n=1 Tax=Mesorhizobium hawassense TaxID=1209954 RepID=UPI00142E03B3